MSEERRKRSQGSRVIRREVRHAVAMGSKLAAIARLLTIFPTRYAYVDSDMPWAARSQAGARAGLLNGKLPSFHRLRSMCRSSRVLPSGPRERALMLMRNEHDSRLFSHSARSTGPSLLHPAGTTPHSTGTLVERSGGVA